ncbi:996_t:CDS:2 [Dentiscutata heterogama]|uniref:996_t:CDS:1 n=1 Tax=Dentiscutata heterogama TaxID=1316150 RepID=A0ACA9K1E9_9GLOM|nr:996_t:CDS:2 [Dentiscutata heterogama]
MARVQERESHPLDEATTFYSFKSIFSLSHPTMLALELRGQYVIRIPKREVAKIQWGGGSVGGHAQDKTCVYAQLCARFDALFALQALDPLFVFPWCTTLVELPKQWTCKAYRLATLKQPFPYGFMTPETVDYVGLVPISNISEGKSFRGPPASEKPAKQWRLSPFLKTGFQARVLICSYSSFNPTLPRRSPREAIAGSRSLQLAAKAARPAYNAKIVVRAPTLNNPMNSLLVASGPTEAKEPYPPATGALAPTQQKGIKRLDVKVFPTGSP